MNAHPVASPRSSWCRLVEVAETFLAMSGWRIRHLNAAWVLGGVASLALGRWLIALNDRRATLLFYASSLAFYYVGNTLILTSRLPARLVERHGEERAFRMYETVLALMFINQGLGVGCLGALDLGPSWTLPASPAVYTLGAALFGTGLVVKVWATMIIGVDIYYYRDMFLGRALAPFVAAGPYKVFSNPMYGVGQLHAYGYAILSRSIAGVLATALCHVLIYTFYYVVERPFVRRIHAGPAAT